MNKNSVCRVSAKTSIVVVAVLVATALSGFFVLPGNVGAESASEGAVSTQVPRGDLDRTFGIGGIVTTPILAGNDLINDIAIQPDGKIIAVGNTAPTTSSAAARYNPNGSLDTTFDGDGKLVMTLGVGANDIQAVALQPDGKIVIAGSWAPVPGGQDFGVVRLNPDGSFDTTFGGGDGIATTPISPTGGDNLRAMKLQSDGKIVVVGNAPVGSPASQDFTVVRFNNDGSLDTSFDTDGIVTTPVVAGQTDTAYSVDIQPDGKIVAAGATFLQTLADDAAVVRYNTDGSLDTSFGGGDGIVITHVVSLDRINRVLIQPDGKILGGGHAASGSPLALNFLLVKYNADGSPDTTFDTDGVATVLIGASSAMYDMAVQPDGKIVTAGVSSAGTTATTNFTTARFKADGSPDTNFGNGGKVITPVSPTQSDQSFAMRLQPDGKIVAAGEVNTTSSNKDFALVRYGNDAVVDFDGDGITDVAIMRSAGIGAPYFWWILNSGDGSVTNFQLGLRPRDIPAPADYDGDGKDDIAMWRTTPQPGQLPAYYILNSSTGVMDIIPFGQPGDVPVTEDYDGDGKADLSTWRAPGVGSTGQATWYYRASANNPNNDITYVPWGMRYEATQSSSVDEPYPGDFDGDGKADFRVQRHADITTTANGPAIFYTLTAAGVFSVDYFGLKEDRIVPGDYDGDGKTDLCVVRGFNFNPGNSTWYIRYSSGIPDDETIFGSGFDFAQGDYDGDGATDIAYFMKNPMPAGFWYLASSANREPRYIRWGSTPPVGLAAELPIANYNNR